MLFGCKSGGAAAGFDASNGDGLDVLAPMKAVKSSVVAADAFN